MRPVDLSTNISQLNEVGRIQRVADRVAEQGQQALSDDAAKMAARQPEQVKASPKPEDSRYYERRDRNAAGGDAAAGKNKDSKHRSRKNEEPAARNTNAADGKDDKGRILDVQI